MSANKKYLYQIPGGDTFIGNTKKQIISTLKYYKDLGKEKIEIPSKKDIPELEKTLKISYSLPIPTLFEKNFEIEIVSGIELIINKNALFLIEAISQEYMSKKIGALYKFQTPDSDLYFFPKETMIALNKYDWKQHHEQVIDWFHAEVECGKLHLDRLYGKAMNKMSEIKEAWNRTVWGK